MKVLSIAVPCYNSAAYMDHCISTLLHGGDEVEILIVDDGSAKDNTAEIADKYEKMYPGILKKGCLFIPLHPSKKHLILI